MAGCVSGGLVRSPRCSFSLCFFRFASFLLFSGWFFLSSRSSSLFFFRSSLFLLSPSFYLLLSLSSVFSFFLPVSPLFFLFSFPFLFSPFSPSFPQRSWPLFIEAKDAAFYSSHGGSSRLVGHWARLPRFGGWCAVDGRPLCPVGGLQAREWPAKFKLKLPFLLLHRCVTGGRR